MGTDEDADGISITEPAKQAGAAAFAQAMGKGTYDALSDETLFAETMELWDCETVGELKGRVVADDPPGGAVNALLERARAAYLVAALTVLGVGQVKKKRGR